MSAANQIFSEAQRELLSAVLNRIIPGQGDRPGAGDLGVASFVERVAAGAPGPTRLFNEGLNAINVAASKDHSGGFLAMPEEAKDDTLREIEAANPLFFDQLVQQTYDGYYTDTRVFDVIGYNVPKPPVGGARPKLLDESLLEKQRQRAPFWRRV